MIKTFIILYLSIFVLHLVLGSHKTICNIVEYANDDSSLYKNCIDESGLDVKEQYSEYLKRDCECVGGKLDASTGACSGVTHNCSKVECYRRKYISGVELLSWVVLNNKGPMCTKLKEHLKKMSKPRLSAKDLSYGMKECLGWACGPAKQCNIADHSCSVNESKVCPDINYDIGCSNISTVHSYYANENMKMVPGFVFKSKFFTPKIPIRELNLFKKQLSDAINRVDELDYFNLDIAYFIQSPNDILVFSPDESGLVQIDVPYAMSRKYTLWDSSRPANLVKKYLASHIVRNNALANMLAPMPQTCEKYIRIQELSGIDTLYYRGSESECYLMTFDQYLTKKSPRMDPCSSQRCECLGYGKGIDNCTLDYTQPIELGKKCWMEMRQCYIDNLLPLLVNYTECRETYEIFRGTAVSDFCMVTECKAASAHFLTEADLKYMCNPLVKGLENIAPFDDVTTDKLAKYIKLLNQTDGNDTIMKKKRVPVLLIVASVGGAILISIIALLAVKLYRSRQNSNNHNADFINMQ